MLFIPNEKCSVQQYSVQRIRCFKLLVPSRYTEQRWWEKKDDDTVFYSIHEAYRYKLGKLNKDSRWGQEPPRMPKIYGFRSWMYSTDAFSVRWNTSLDTVVVECIIPAGARYMVNPDSGEFLSDSLVCIRYYPIWLSIVDGLINPFYKLYNKLFR